MVRASQVRFIPMKDGRVMLESPYSPVLVARLKSVLPTHARRWDNEQRMWAISPDYVSTAAGICEDVYGVRPEMPKKAEPEMKIVFLEYLGNIKIRGASGNASANGWYNDGWNLAFPEDVLYNWFLHTPNPSVAASHYGTLGISSVASEQEIKEAHRRAARTHHPDAGGDATQFLAIQAAYETLKDPIKRGLYDSGLAIAASIPQDKNATPAVVWKPPTRCGNLLVLAHPFGARLLVTRILQWQDVIRDGKTLATYWVYGDKTFTERWR